MKMEMEQRFPVEQTRKWILNMELSVVTMPAWGGGG